MRVHESLLNLHKCASGSYTNSNGVTKSVLEDPHVIYI